MKGNKLMVETLLKEKVDVLFGINGGAIIPFYDALYDYKGQIRNILVRHEQGAAHAAEGYARASGKVGTCVATSGPGGCNLVTGIADALMDSVPIVAIGGQVPTHLIGNDAFQETDMIGITTPITKHNFQIRNVDDIPLTIRKAYKLAREGRPGPVYIDVPKDVQLKESNAAIPEKVEIPSYKPTIYPNPFQLKRAVKLILEAERPLILAGGGTIIANAHKELLEFAETLVAPVSSTTMAKGVFPEDHPLSLHVTGMHGTEAANYAIINTDVLIAVGCRFSDRITGDTKSFQEGKKVIHIDIDPSEIGKNVAVEIPVVGDARIVLSELTKILISEGMKDKNKPSAWRKKLDEIKELCDAAEDKAIANEGLTQKFCCRELSKFIREDAIITTGVGQHQMFGEHFIMRKNPRTWITSGGAGTMGFGMPAAMGAKVAKPDVEVYDLDGDGSFQMTLQELATLKEEKIKVVPIIMNNNYLGMVRQWLELFQKRRYSGVGYSANPSFEKIAQAYHLNGITVKTKNEFIDALNQARKNDETTVIDVMVEEEENILPMLPPASKLKEIIGGSVIFKQNWEDVLAARR
ncbi:MAG: biosynthetic-type acetolactate synthase large subunit [Nanoarchaeota archaeon]